MLMPRQNTGTWKANIKNIHVLNVIKHTEKSLLTGTGPIILSRSLTMNIKSSAIITVLLLSIFAINGAAPAAESQLHKGESSRSIDKAEAIKIAVTEWERIFGKEKIAGEKPYQAILKDGIWFVSGSLPRGSKGGVAEAEIRKKDGQIISIKHGK